MAYKENNGSRPDNASAKKDNYDYRPGSPDNQMPHTPRIRVGITHGDFNGIGYEVILKALDDVRILELCTPVIYGSAKIAGYYRKSIEALSNQPINQIQDASELRHDVINLVNVIGQEAHITPGESTNEAGNAAFLALESAVADLRAGNIDVIVTAPINKNNIQSEQFTYHGHTEYFEAIANGQMATSVENEAARTAADTDGNEAQGHINSLMVLCSEGLRVALVTNHLPLAEVAANISEERIIDKLRLFEHSLIQDFGIVKPRIAVLALNPHSGDGGLLGTEEEQIILPAIDKVRQEGMLAFGPYPADGFFGNGLYSRFDGVLAMYHDQGLIPFKTLAMESGVNFTAGLPFVRTSPDHGTGYDIAGHDRADASSMRSAIFTAIDILRRRKNYRKATARPLPKLFVEKGKDNVVLDLSKD